MVLNVPYVFQVGGSGVVQEIHKHHVLQPLTLVVKKLFVEVPKRLSNQLTRTYLYLLLEID